MRLVFLITRDWIHPEAAGGDIAFGGLARAAARAGHAVTYICCRDPARPPVEELEGVRVVRLGGLISQSFLTFAYYRRALRGRADVVVEEAIGGLRVPYLAPLYVREPLLCHWHQPSAPLSRRQFSGPLLGAALAAERFTMWAHRGRFNTSAAAERIGELRRAGLDGSALRLLPWALGEEELRRATLNSSRRRARPPTLVYLGKFRAYKCAHHLIEAASVLPRATPFRLVFAGRSEVGDALEELRGLSERRGLLERTEFRLNLREEEKYALLAKATAVVVPAPVEGFSLVSLEASACGTPVIASDGVPADVVRDGVTGLRYPFGDVAALAECILRLTSDRGFWRALSQAGRTHARSFTWQRTLGLLEQYARDATAEHLSDTKDKGTTLPRR